MATKMHVPGTAISIDTAGGTSYSAQTDVISVTVFEETTEATDVTVLASTGRVMEFIGKSFIDGGECAWELFFHYTMFGTLRTALLAGTACGLKWAGPVIASEGTPTSIAGSVILTKIGMPQRGTSAKGAYTFEMTAKWTGAKTVTNGS